MHARPGWFRGFFFVLLASSWVSGSQFDIVINEICYNPWSGSSKDEFVELYNRGPAPVDLSGWSVTEGISFSFSPGLSLGAHQYLVLSPDVAHTKLLYGIGNVAGSHTGKLDKEGA